LNWGASYLVHDLYRRFLNPTATEGHYVLAGRVATVALFVISSATVYALDTAKSAFDIILQVGAGTGLLYLARWFWWRVNASCEVVAMVSSLVVSVVLLILADGYWFIAFALVTTVIATTVLGNHGCSPRTGQCCARSA
jgi:Na+/proline symporter